MSSDLVYLDKDQIDWDFVNIRESHGEESFELWQSLDTHGQLQPGAGWWLENGKFRILYGHRRAVVLTTHERKFMALIVPKVNDVLTIEKQLIENEQRLSLNPKEEEVAIKILRDYYCDDEIVSKRIGRSKSWIKLKISANNNRESISKIIDNQNKEDITLTNKDLENIPSTLINKTMDTSIDPAIRLKILDNASKQKGGISGKNIEKAIYIRNIESANNEELKIDLINKEAEKAILQHKENEIKKQIRDLNVEILNLKKRLK